LRKVWQVEREFASRLGAADRRRRLASWNTALQQTMLGQR
jgi:hypothetical protein